MERIEGMDKIKDKLSFNNALKVSLGLNIILYMVMFLVVISRFNEQVTNRTEEWTFEMGMSGIVAYLGISFLLTLIAICLVQGKKRILSGVVIVILSVVQMLTMEKLRGVFVDISRKKNVITVENLKLSKPEKYIKWTNILVGASAGLYLVMSRLAEDLKYYDFSMFNVKEILNYIRLDWLAMELLEIGIPFMLFIVIVGGALVKKGDYLLNIILYALYICMVYNALFWERSWSYYEFEYEEMAGFPQFICMVILGAMVMLGGVFLKLGRRYGAKLVK